MIGCWVIYDDYKISFDPVHKELGIEVDDIVRSFVSTNPSDHIRYSGEVVYNNRTQMYEIRYLEDGFNKDHRAIDLILYMFKLNYLRCDILQGDCR